MATNDEQTKNIPVPKRNYVPKNSGDFPKFAYCPHPENQEEAELAFKNSCPEDVEITKVEHVVITKDFEVCYWRVSFSIIDENGVKQNLPQKASELNDLFDKLSNCVPPDCIATEKEVTTQTVATVLYKVLCENRAEGCTPQIPSDDPPPIVGNDDVDDEDIDYGLGTLC